MKHHSKQVLQAHFNEDTICITALGPGPSLLNTKNINQLILDLNIYGN